MAELSKDFPAGVAYMNQYDGTVFISQSVHEVVMAILGACFGGARCHPVLADMAGFDHPDALSLFHWLAPLQFSPAWFLAQPPCRCLAWCCRRYRGG